MQSLMADYHTTYKGPEGHTTEWDDIQVQITPPPFPRASLSCCFPSDPLAFTGHH